jgi:hypothetical protein
MDVKMEELDENFRVFWKPMQNGRSITVLLAGLYIC